jgi:hypothetical protein
MMQILLKCLWIAGLIQVGMVLANVYLPSKLEYSGNISRMSTIVRQVFITHAFYIAGVVLLFAVVTFPFPADLVSGHGLGRFLAGAISIFWFCRMPLQLFYYDASVRRANRFGDVGMTFALVFLTATYGVAAISPSLRVQ